MIADGNKLFAEGLRSIISSQADLSVAGCSVNGPDTVSAALASKPSLLIADFALHGLGIADVLTRLREELPGLRTLVLSQNNDLRSLLTALSCGADGFASRDMEPEDLLKAVRTVLDGQVFLTRESVRLLLGGYMKSRCLSGEEDRLKMLSVREREVLALIEKSATIKEIAETLCISRSTAESHRTNLMRKLNCPSTAALIRFAIKENMLGPDD